MVNASWSIRLKYTEVVRAMHRQENALRLWQSTPPCTRECVRSVTALLTMSVSSHFAANADQQIVNRIVQSRAAGRGLQLKLRIGAEAGRSASVSLGLRRLVESFDFSPLQAHHVERDLLELRDVLGMLRAATLPAVSPDCAR